ncbi:MAG: P-type conjugative transfer protein TrbJ [Alphaproteobacteria bacterium]|nr:P-type conjugative transfer protein TrbJ [Alphaproteobacteria bacterium]
MNILKQLLLATTTALVLAGSPAQAMVVFDPSNFAENVLQAARALEQINNQIKSLQNEAVMLENMAKHLEKLGFSSLGDIEATLKDINQLMAKAKGIAFEVKATESAFKRLFPEQYSASVTSSELGQGALERWSEAMKALEHTMTVQAQVVANVDADGTTLSRLVTESQAAVGSLQAQQASNQLIALSAKQQLQTQELMAAQYRAEALEQARQAQAQEQARAQFKRFVGDGQVYTPNN